MNSNTTNNAGGLYSHSATQDIPIVAKVASPNLPSLNGIRVILAFFVYLFHTSLDNMLSPFSDPEINTAYAFLLSKSGWVSVSFFFILSGFVMNWSSKPVGNTLIFYKKKFARIYPVNIIVMLLLVATGVINISRIDIWLPNALLIQSWLPNGENYIGGNTPSWFLCTIVLFYLLFPFLQRVIRAIPTAHLWTSIGFLYLIMIATQIIIALYTPATPYIEGWPLLISESRWWLSYTFPLTRLPELIIGMLLSRVIQEGKWIPISITTSLILTAITYSIDLFIPLQFSFNLVTLIPLLLVIGSLTVSDINQRRSFLHTKPMQWLGNLSFGFYMIHFLVLKLIMVWADGAKYDVPEATFLVVAGMVLSLLGAWLLYKFVELPASKWITSKTWLNFRRDPQKTGTTS
ncbi:acyltransferase family protein [Pectobacterium odoriferum]|uniref:acyltransferase family protein n=1 Tax=Pectobacterium odoriferum TaxID=78398 RepID=UPI0005C6D2C0|nr:acyltransferase [Pectobacterium odoriferum]MBA0189501.1 acyltransferase [Pectobacterium odoriferum]MCA6963182.1 acyltransferase [Pectobacterium odoriferum]MCH5011271.1 acyltransferase [Pectobacterium odoriferum]POD89971.1 acyltransferase [Pectobacterium odoriferum]POD99883.1 acyltransferase [Pectobacterium odoriferum]